MSEKRRRKGDGKGGKGEKRESEDVITANTLKQKEKGSLKLVLDKELFSCGIADAAEMFAILILLIFAHSGKFLLLLITILLNFFF